MKNIKLLATLIAFALIPFASNAAAVYNNCYFDEYGYEVCTTETDSRNFDISGTVESYIFDASSTGQQTSPFERRNISGSLNMTTVTQTFGDGSVDWITINGTFDLRLSDSPELGYSATFTQYANTGDVVIDSEAMTGITWAINTPTLWELSYSADGSVALNTIPNLNAGNYPGFNPLNGILSGQYGNIAFDVTATGTLSAVPVPAAAWLFASGLLALMGFAKRQAA